MISAVRAPASRAAASAAFVAVVPPSCEMPITSPVDGGSSDSSKACSATRLAGRDATRAGQAGGAHGFAKDLGDTLRRVLGRAAPGHDDRCRPP